MAQSLDAERGAQFLAMVLVQFLVRQGGAKVSVVLANQRQRPPPQPVRQPVVGGPPAPARNQGCRTLTAHPLQQTPQMTLGYPHLRRRLRLPKPRALDPLENRQTLYFP
ncbi:MAG: hypothetical protein OXU22_04820 [Gammaproteobacteria bacterium]|nr:hypothetical protein [Gammaproteobacteria bacterium]